MYHQLLALISRLLQGALAGAGATLPMTIIMYALRYLLLPRNTEPIGPDRTTRWVEAQTGLEQHLDRPKHWALMLTSHVGYGALAGMAYVPFAAGRSAVSLLRGMVFGLVVWAASYAGWLPALHIIPFPPHRSSSRRVILISAHLVWGAALAFFLAYLQRVQEEKHHS